MRDPSRVAGNADDGVALELLADGIFARPLPQRERLADDDPVRVAGLELAAAQDRNPQRGEEGRCDVVEVDVHRSFGRLGPGRPTDGRQAAAWTPAPPIPRPAARQVVPAGRRGRPGPSPSCSRARPAPDRPRSPARSRSRDDVDMARSTARTNRPATMSNTQLAATCAPIRPWRRRLARWRCRTTCQAGARPNIIAAVTPMPMAKTNTRQSGLGSSHGGASVASITSAAAGRPAPFQQPTPGRRATGSR